MTTKTYARRDSCTAALKKLGIDKKDYDFFIDKQGDQFICRLDKAARHLAQLKEQATAPKLDEKSKAMKKQLDAAAAAKTPKQQAAPRTTCSGRARELIRAGKTNQEVWAVIKAEFNLDDGKKHYPGWYRSEMKRTGQLG